MPQAPVEFLVEALIKQQTGIDAAIVGSGLIRSAIGRQMRAHQINELSTYWQLLQKNAAAVQQLVETVVVPETWFFRDRSPFQFLVDQFKRQQSVLAARPCQILSVPCSTGEEPYSIAMALLQARMSTAQFQIDAIDISQQNIQQALAGIYPPFSFRNDDANLKAEFFDRVGEKYHLHDRVKRLVQFRTGNILRPQTWPIGECYDVIFCRNLLIYFDLETRQRVLCRLNQLLKPTGWLFVGHAESSVLLNAGWQGARVPFTFAYQKPTQPNAKLMAVRLSMCAPTARTVATSIRQANAKSQPNRLRPTNATSQTLPQSSSPQSSPKKLPVPVPLDPVGHDPVGHDASIESDQVIDRLHHDRLQQARQCADRGELVVAKQLCAQQLQDSPLQPEVYLLLGQIHQAQNQSSMAETYFRKTLYLQPDSLDALIHLARLTQNRGDRTTADRLYQRIERLQSD